jgi:hypothetical protein
MSRHLHFKKDTDVSEDRNAFIFRANILRRLEFSSTPL